MKIRPLELLDANKFVVKNHRHHEKVQGHKFSLGALDGDKLVGVAIIGRPVSRYLDNGTALEVTRLCTDGTKNACSFLYSAAARVAREMGYNAIITYILKSESGKSLEAAGWKLENENAGGKKWKRNDGERTDEIVDLFGSRKKYPNELKKRYAKRFAKSA